MTTVDTSIESDAWALLALKYLPSNKLSSWSDQDNCVLARLHSEEFEYIVRQKKILVGRSRAKQSVHVSGGSSNFISRRHLQICFENSIFSLLCLGKNGIFVDGRFQRQGKTTSLPKSCTIRFPSTDIIIQFQSLIEQSPIATGESTPSSQLLSPLKINIPDEASYFSSPLPSPTGTISAANSCPASPKGDVHKQADTDVFDSNHSDIFEVNNSASLNKTLPPNDLFEINYSKDTSKPPYSYAQLISQAIVSSPEKQLTLSAIYSYITKHYPYYRNADKGWQNSIRHNLSLNRYFVKVPRSQEEPGKGSFWKIESSSESKLIEQAFKKRRQRGVTCFRTPFHGFSTSHNSLSGVMSPEFLSHECSPVHECFSDNLGCQLAPDYKKLSVKKDEISNRESANTSKEAFSLDQSNVPISDITILQDVKQSVSSRNALENGKTCVCVSSSADSPMITSPSDVTEIYKNQKRKAEGSETFSSRENMHSLKKMK